MAAIQTKVYTVEWHSLMLMTLVQQSPSVILRVATVSLVPSLVMGALPILQGDTPVGWATFPTRAKNLQTHRVRVAAQYVLVKAWSTGGGCGNRPRWPDALSPHPCVGSGTEQKIYSYSKML